MRPALLAKGGQVGRVLYPFWSWVLPLSGVGLVDFLLPRWLLVREQHLLWLSLESALGPLAVLFFLATSFSGTALGSTGFRTGETEVKHEKVSPSAWVTFGCHCVSGILVQSQAIILGIKSRQYTATRWRQISFHLGSSFLVFWFCFL